MRIQTSTAILALAGILGLPGAAPAAAARVNDEGKFFSSAAIEKANEGIRQIQQRYGKDLLVETVSGVPADREAQLKEQGKGKFFNGWAEERAARAGVRGIYVLLSKQPGHIQIEVDKATRTKALTLEDRDRLVQQLLPLLKEKKNDEALQAAVDFVETTLGANVGKKTAAGAAAGAPQQTNRGGPAAHSNKPAAASQNPLLQWVCIGAGVLLAVWVVIAIIRAFSGGGTGLAGAGGGGGGFFTSLLGGLFGAVVGHWLYDSFFHGSGWGGSEAHGASGGDEAGAGDFGGDSGGGGDFGGGDFGGGDFGGGDF